MSQIRSTIRCAVYTRKSSEEGLEQSFNSLHAQREACEAYVLSQRHEGWQLLPTQYDDAALAAVPGLQDHRVQVVHGDGHAPVGNELVVGCVEPLVVR